MSNYVRAADWPLVILSCPLNGARSLIETTAATRRLFIAKRPELPCRRAVTQRCPTCMHTHIRACRYTRSSRHIFYFLSKLQLPVPQHCRRERLRKWWEAERLLKSGASHFNCLRRKNMFAWSTPKAIHGGTRCNEKMHLEALNCNMYQCSENTNLHSARELDHRSYKTDNMFLTLVWTGVKASWDGHSRGADHTGSFSHDLMEKHMETKWCCTLTMRGTKAS